MMDLGTADWIAVGAVAVLTGMAKAGLGGLGIVAMVIMALVMPAKQSTGALLTILIAADLYAVTAYRRHANWSQVLRLLPPALVGIFFGWLLMPRIPDAVFRPMLGWLTIALVVLFVWQRLSKADARLAHHPLIGLFAGCASGVTTMLANAAGPITTIYLLARRMPKMEFVGTAAWFFFAINLAKVPFSISLGLITPGSLLMTLILVPAVLVGGVAGRWIVGRIPQGLYDGLLVVFTLCGGLRLIWG